MIGTRRPGRLGQLVTVAIALGACHRRAPPSPRAPDVAVESARPWAELDGRGMGPFWSCVFGKDVDVERLENAQQVRRLVEAAYDGQPATFARWLLDGCLPRIATVRQALAALPATPDTAARSAYGRSLAELEAAVRLYAGRLASWERTEELDEEIVVHARAWARAGAPTGEARAYARFLPCAVPDWQRMTGRDVYRFLAESCFRHDPVAFMQRVRARCAPLLLEAGPAPSVSMRRLRDAAGEQAQAWSSCAEIAAEQQRLADARELLAAVTGYLAARPVPLVRAISSPSP